MRVLVLGGTGFIGRRLGRLLALAGMDVRLAARRVPARSDAHEAGNTEYLALDTRDAFALGAAVRQCDAVVNAVAGRPEAIAEGAQRLAQALRDAGGRPVVHVSSMAVYGDIEGEVAAHTPWGPLPGRAHGGPYALAKRLAEAEMAALAGIDLGQAGRLGAIGHASPGTLARPAAALMPVAVLRPGCVWGPGSPLWVDRIADLLAAGRLGDLGEDGDGWTNGVHVDDVCEAALRLLQSPEAGLRVFPLAAPDSPRWNGYLRDLALAVGATPLARPWIWRLRADAWLAGPPLQLATRLRAMAGGRGPRLPPPLPPGLLDLMRRQLRMDASAAGRELGLRWTPYLRALHQGAAAWRPRAASQSERARNTGLPST